MMLRFDRIVLWALLGCILLAHSPQSIAAGERILHVFTWQDYFDSEVVSEFQKTYDCKVVLEYFESNELLYEAILYDSGGYDIITPSSYMAAMLNENGLLLPLEHGKIPNIRHLEADAAALSSDTAMAYSIPYIRSVTGIGYRKSKVPQEALDGWDIFANVSFAGRMTMLDDMRESLGAALKLLGHSLNSTNEAEIVVAGNVVRDWMRNLATFDVEEARAGLVGGRYVVVHGYNGDMSQAMSDDADIGFFIPEEGSSMVMDDFVISSNSPEPDLAHAFINHMLEPEMARRNMETILYYMPNAAALKMLDPVLLNNPAFSVPPETLAACEVIRPLGNYTAIYEKVWREVMAARATR